MAKSVQYDNYIRNLKAQAVLTALAGGNMKLYDGAMPANGQALPAGTLLVTINLTTPAGVLLNGVITFTDPGVALGVAASNASVGALFTAGGQHVANFNVGPTNSDGFALEFDSVSILVGGEVDMQSFSWTEAATE
jgi:hypothetical protein